MTHRPLALGFAELDVGQEVHATLSLSSTRFDVLVLLPERHGHDMRQATLPCAAPLPSLHSAEPSVDYHPHSPRPASPAPYQRSTPPLSYAQPHQPALYLEQQLDPALFSSSHVETRAERPPDGSSLEPTVPHLPLQAPDMVSRSSSVSSSDASSGTVPASPQQSALSSLADTQASLTPAQPLSSSTVPAAPLDQTANKLQPPLHPFFKPGTFARPKQCDDDSDPEQRRPARSSRTKAPVSYREDLKAVLRADAAHESARLKEEKRQAQLANRAQRPLQDKRAKPNAKHAHHDADGFELVEARVATPIAAGNKSVPSVTASASQPTSSSKPQPQPAAKIVQPKPLSLAVKGTDAAATANPHPFFTKKHKQPPPPADSSALSQLNNGAENETGLPPASDGTAQAPSSKPSASLSGPSSNAAPASWSLFAAPRASASKPKKPVQALWPSHEDTHVVGLRDNEQALLSKARSELPVFRARWSSRPTPSSRPHIQDAGPPSDFVARMNRARPDPVLSGISLADTMDTLDSIDDFVAQYVDASRLPPLSFSQLVQQGESCQRNGQLWIDAYRPYTAAACLGNEANAAYLLEWLRRLLVAAPGMVRTTDKKRKTGIQRRVDRRRKKRARRGYSDDEDDSDDMADFIVDDDDQEDGVGEYDETVTDEEWFSRFAKIDRKSTLSEDESVELAASQTTASDGATTRQELNTATQLQPQSQFASLEKLTNCIVLSGPSGAGKTASVYACASELGYEVFELYPGMGKRSGKELLSAVGDLGRNHMVSSGGVGGGATFKPKLAPSSSATAGTSAGTVRQSLILIEEADILFEEDKGFWAAVVELVAASKRPVVVVCNELELVPVHELPVQQVLEFEKPSIDKVVPWLQTVAAGSGRFVTADKVKDMVLRLDTTENPSRVAGGADEGVLGVDLRQAMQQLQFGHIASSRDDAQDDLLQTLAAANADMKDVAHAAESSSLADIFERGIGRQADVEASGDFGVDHLSSSRQLGSWIQLVPQPLGLQQQRQALTGRMHVDYRSAFTHLHTTQTGAASCSAADTSRGAMCPSIDVQLNHMQ